MIELIYLIVKIAIIIFTLLHLFSVLVIMRQVNLALKTIETRARRGIKMLVLVRAIILFLNLIIVVILPI